MIEQPERLLFTGKSPEEVLLGLEQKTPYTRHGVLGLNGLLALFGPNDETHCDRSSVHNGSLISF